MIDLSQVNSYLENLAAQMAKGVPDSARQQITSILGLISDLSKGRGSTFSDYVSQYVSLQTFDAGGSETTDTVRLSDAKLPMLTQFQYTKASIDSVIRDTAAMRFLPRTLLLHAGITCANSTNMDSMTYIVRDGNTIRWFNDAAYAGTLFQANVTLRAATGNSPVLSFGKCDFPVSVQGRTGSASPAYIIVPVAVAGSNQAFLLLTVNRNVSYELESISRDFLVYNKANDTTYMFVGNSLTLNKILDPTSGSVVGTPTNYTYPLTATNYQSPCVQFDSTAAIGPMTNDIVVHPADYLLSAPFASGKYNALEAIDLVIAYINANG